MSTASFELSSPEAFALSKADAALERSLKKSKINTRAETEIFRKFTALEKAEYLKECFGKYHAPFTAKVFGLDAEVFAGPLWHFQQVAFLKRRVAQFAPLEHLFAK